MAKLFAILFLAAVLVAVASSQYLAYPRAAVVASPYAYRAYTGAPAGVAYTGFANPGYAGRGLIYG